MNNNIEPIKVKSIKDTCIDRLEGLILSGQFRIGDRLPSERDFALQIGVSRPMLHEALVDLDAKGLVQIIPRRGVYVCDYRRSGSLKIGADTPSACGGEEAPSFFQDFEIMLY